MFYSFLWMTFSKLFPGDPILDPPDFRDPPLKKYNRVYLNRGGRISATPGGASFLRPVPRSVLAPSSKARSP